mmetsp:Transcript_36851/g.66260  ORF Transcript_36851/g.66260 Transcript_36851/m.66260 type:complete len:622 (+) Transcript_36851:121-1986(+)|eukprot:CAMPEP_0201921954 /NCGR_PEP_ID=MMETSP0903-20130614/10132_1 /ASSEMBLY_ACC=CAM_ASM_000552 /TAXON_ID=420261 /ORGANISM="Thalassiosira antarctica, Strain CCMP982" /LENGTH=621 /DNA_ID=CAMNT_0048458999 /DNA_START=67 /DNA_END=1932 /DNA_ORIENTATION=-
MAPLTPLTNTNTNMSDDAWRDSFIEYYTTNAPTKVLMVNDKMMAKWSGKYEILMKNLIEKYGPLGAPIDQPQVPKRSKPALTNRRPFTADRGASSSSAPSIDEHASKFNALISAATPTALPPRDLNLNVVESKASNSQNGLETSTFTVCTRVRPLLGPELINNAGGGGGLTLSSVVPGRRTSIGGNYTEELLLHTPKVSITGNATLDTLSHHFDYVFGPDSTNEEIYDLACAPLVKRALNGQVGVIFAYGQTGSGKTHTMSGILDILATSAIFSDLTNITFSYIEMLGREIRDCLPDAGEGKGVQIGEGLNGAVLIRNMKTHVVADAAQLGTLIKRANATRATAATAKNETSSRSHGVAILKVTNKKTSVEGTLYVIDLAGSESAKDSKDHDKHRMKETKEINSSLLVLKDCIRARTNAAAADDGIHVPYRRNKLTLLMKDVFDIGCSRLCSTVVIANCSPLVSDISHTKNTVKYAAPLRVAVASSNRQKNLELDVFDPALWTNDAMVAWVDSVASGKIDAKLFVNSLTGVQFCALSENEFYARAEAQAQLGEEEGMMEIAKTLYMGMWTLIVDAKTRKRRPDGSIITPEQEEEERRRLEEETVERAKVWAEREKFMKSEF